MEPVTLVAPDGAVIVGVVAVSLHVLPVDMVIVEDGECQGYHVTGQGSTDLLTDLDFSPAVGGSRQSLFVDENGRFWLDAQVSVSTKEGVLIPLCPNVAALRPKVPVVAGTVVFHHGDSPTRCRLWPHPPVEERTVN